MTSKTSTVKDSALPDTKNPSLKKYFKYMVNSRKLTIQFSQGKIREIIEKDLQIDFSTFSNLLKEVSTEAFAFYIQGWPGWQPNNFQQCIDNEEESYSKFKQYLKDKILSLREKEQEYVNPNNTSTENASFSNVNDNNVSVPSVVFSKLPVGPSNYKIKLPYTLEILGKPSFLSALNFQVEGDSYVLNLKQYDYENRKHLSVLQVINHPYVLVQFKIPTLIKFCRTNSHKIEMFLCKPSDTWTFPKQERILDIRKFPLRTNVYTFNFMQEFFNTLINVTKKYNRQITDERREEVSTICTEFLNDIAEANLYDSTVQECTEVCYNIGGSMYYSDSTKDVTEAINLRKIYNPHMTYSLTFCGIQKEDINDDGSKKYFDFIKTDAGPKAWALEKEFIQNIYSAIHYNCIMCSTHFDNINSLKEHLALVHPCHETVRCTLCAQEFALYDLLGRRWKHDCPPRL